MVAHFEFLLDQLANSLQRPAIRWKSTRQSATVQQAFELFFLRLTQFGLTTGGLPASETFDAFCFHHLCPITDSGSAYAQVPSNLCLGQLVFLQKTTAFQSSFFHLFAGQV